MHVVREHEVPCPECGYDLRAAVREGAGFRCPECGTVSWGKERSRIPWVHWRQKGIIRAYLQTVWMTLRRPEMLGRETQGRLGARDSQRFERISLGIGSLVGAALFGVEFWMNPRHEPRLAEGAYWVTPAFALTDSWLGLLIFAVSLYVSAWAGMGCYRWMMQNGARGIERRRVGRVMRYASGIWVVEAMLLGGMWLLARESSELLDSSRRLSDWLGLGALTLGAVALATYLWPTIAIVTRCGRRKLLRGGMLVVGLPVIFATMLAGLTFLMFWCCGYAAMAIWSMTR